MMPPTCPPPARLTGFTEQFGELSSCSIVFHLAGEEDQHYHLRLGDVLRALRFAEAEGVIEALPVAWWVRAREIDRDAVQLDAGDAYR